MAVCSICLRTNLTVNKVNKPLFCFYEKLVEDGFMKHRITLCATCEQLLKKCHDFQQLCQESNKILQNWRKKKKKTEVLTEDLYILVQPYFDKILEGNDEKQIKTESEQSLKPEYNTINDDLIPNNDNEFNENGIENSDNEIEKNEVLIETNDSFIPNKDILKEPVEQNFPIEPKQETDSNLIDIEYGIGENSNNDYDGIKDNFSDSEDDKVISQLLNNIKVKKKSESKKKNKKEVKKNIEKNCEGIVKRKREKQPLKNKQEFESIFDIIYFKTDEEAKAEFSERPNTAYYVKANYKCMICYIVFKYQKLLDFHMKWHDPSSGDHICDICKMRFKTHLSMRKHKNSAHYGKYSCKMCPLITYQKMVMIMHSRKHQGVEYKCKHCNKIYNHSSTYWTHMRTSHRSPHECPQCARTFVSPAGLRVHRLKVHQGTSDVVTDSSVKCNDCNLTFLNEDVYAIHVLNTPSHKDIAASMIACPECGKRFGDKLELRNHRREVHPNYNYTWLKRTHKLEPEKRTFTCRECGATGGHNSWMYNHYKYEHPELTYEAAIYSDERKHLCDQCGRSFRHASQLSEHVHVHTGARPHACCTCSARFRTAAGLALHAERHRPPNRTCSLCHKKFVSASNLANHMRKNFEATKEQYTAKLRTTTPSSSDVAEKTHIGERRYKCSICSKGFLHSSSLREHVRGVHLHVRRDRKPRRHLEQTQIDL